MLGIPLPWLVADLVIVLAGLATFAYASRREERPARFLIEAFAFCLCYAAVYENGAAAYLGLYAYGNSILMVGVVPLTVPLLEFLVLYAALLMLERMELPTWAKPVVVGFWGMLQDLTLDPLAVRQVFESAGRRVGRWSWISLAPGEANLSEVPVFNFSGWMLILGLGSAALLAGRWWHRRSGFRPWVGVAYPFVAALAGLGILYLPSSRFLLWLEPVFPKGGAGEWIMFAFCFALATAVLAFVWRGRMRGRLTWREDWPVLVLPALFHLSDLVLVLAGGFTEVLWIEAVFSLVHLGLVALVWRRGARLPSPDRSS